MGYTSPNAQIEANLLQGQNLYASAATTLQQIQSDLSGFSAVLQNAWLGAAFDTYTQKQSALTKDAQKACDVMQKGSDEIRKMYDAYIEADEKQEEALKEKKETEIFMAVLTVVTILLPVIGEIVAAADAAFEAGMAVLMEVMSDVLGDTVGETATLLEEVVEEANPLLEEVENMSEVGSNVGEVNPTGNAPVSQSDVIPEEPQNEEFTLKGGNNSPANDSYNLDPEAPSGDQGPFPPREKEEVTHLPTASSTVSDDGTITTTITETDPEGITTTITKTDPEGITNTTTIVESPEDTFVSIENPDGSGTAVVGRGDGTTTVIHSQTNGTHSASIITILDDGEPAFIANPDGSATTIVDNGDGTIDVTHMGKDGTFSSTTLPRPEEPYDPSIIDSYNPKVRFGEDQTKGFYKDEPPINVSRANDGSMPSSSIDEGLGDQSEVNPNTPKNKGKAVDRGPGDPNTSGSSDPDRSITTENPDGSTTTIKEKTNLGNFGETKTITESTEYPNGSTRITKNIYDVNGKPTGSSIETTEGNVTEHTTFDPKGEPTHHTITTSEGNTTTTKQFDSQGEPIGKSVEVTQGDTTISTDYNANGEVSYRQEITNIRNEKGDIVESKKVITELNTDGSQTITTEKFEIDQNGGRHLDSSTTETIPNPNEPLSGPQFWPSGRVRVAGRGGPPPKGGSPGSGSSTETLLNPNERPSGPQERSASYPGPSKLPSRAGPPPKKSFTK